MSLQVYNGLTLPLVKVARFKTGQLMAESGSVGLERSWQKPRSSERHPGKEAQRSGAMDKGNLHSNSQPIRKRHQQPPLVLDPRCAHENSCLTRTEG